MTTRIVPRPENRIDVRRSDAEIARQMRECGSINPAGGRFNRREQADIILELAGNGCALVSAQSESGARHLSGLFGDSPSIWFSRDRVVRHEAACRLYDTAKDSRLKIKIVSYAPELDALQSE